jgi:hypothetical protein
VTKVWQPQIWYEPNTSSPFATNFFPKILKYHDWQFSKIMQFAWNNQIIRVGLVEIFYKLFHLRSWRRWRATFFLLLCSKKMNSPLRSFSSESVLKKMFGRALQKKQGR